MAEYVYCNGYRAGAEVRGPDVRTQEASTALGIENMAAACVQARGVMVDLEGRFGRARRLVGYDGPDANPGPDHVAVEQGYILCLHTGFTAVVLAMKREPDPTAIYNSCAMLDGADVRLLQWISDSSLAAIAADNYAVEAIPARAGGGRRPFVPLRAHCLFKLGVHLELWYLSELNAWLRARDRSRFLLTAPPLRLLDAVGSLVTPIATV